MSRSGVILFPFIRELQALVNDSGSDSEAEVQPVKTMGDLSILLSQCKHKLKAQTLTTMMDNLASLSIEDQKKVNKIISYVMERCSEHLQNQQKCSHFTIQRVGVILRSLTQLPVSMSKNAELYLLLLTRLDSLPASHFSSPDTNSSILLALAKLDINLQDFMHLLKSLLQPFQESEFLSVDNAFMLSSKLWQFCVFMLTKAKSHQEIRNLCHATRIDALYQTVDKYLKEHEDEHESTESHFQEELCNRIEELLNKEYQQDLQIEYAIGTYQLDLAFPKLKLNIEIDGPTHYRSENLIRSSRFRDYLLSDYFGWKIIRIPLFEWQKQTDKQAKIDYLLLKLTHYPMILNHFAQTRLIFLIKAKQAQEEEEESKEYELPEPKTSSVVTKRIPIQNKPSAIVTTTPTARYLASIFSGFSDDALLSSLSEWKLSDDTVYYKTSIANVAKKKIKALKEFSTANGVKIYSEKDRKKPEEVSLSIKSNCRGLSFFQAVYDAMELSEEKAQAVEQIVKTIYDYSNSK